MELMLTTWPALRLNHVGQDRAGDAHQADQIGLDDVGPVVGGAGIEPRPPADIVPGVVDEDVDRLELRGNGVRQAIHGLPIANVELDRKHRVARRGREFLKRLGVAIDQHDAAAAFQQRLGNGASHAAGGTRQNDALARLFSHRNAPNALMRPTSRRRSAGWRR